MRMIRPFRKEEIIEGIIKGEHCGSIPIHSKIIRPSQYAQNYFQLIPGKNVLAGDFFTAWPRKRKPRSYAFNFR